MNQPSTPDCGPVADPCEHIIARGYDDGRCAACATKNLKLARFVVVPHAERGVMTHRGFVVRPYDNEAGRCADGFNYAGVPIISACYHESRANRIADQLNAKVQA